MLDTVVISGEDVCCSVVFGLVGVFKILYMNLEHLNLDVRGTNEN